MRIRIRRGALHHLPTTLPTPTRAAREVTFDSLKNGDFFDHKGILYAKLAKETAYNSDHDTVHRFKRTTMVIVW